MCIVRHKLEAFSRGPRGLLEDHVKNGGDLDKSIIVK